MIWSVVRSSGIEKGNLESGLRSDSDPAGSVKTPEMINPQMWNLIPEDGMIT